jgi:hypothetical protein
MILLVFLCVAFGLGEVPQHLRVSNLDELAGAAGAAEKGGNSDKKTVVELTFCCQKDTLTTTIGSSIVDKQRLYFVASKKVTKRM